MRKFLCAVVGAAVTLYGSPIAAAPAQPPAVAGTGSGVVLSADVDPLVYSRPAQLVSVGSSRRLNLLCMGSGEPTVLLEAGAGESSATWRKVQGRIAAFTRVCAYDRAGYGQSDPNDRPSTAGNLVDDLHRLLDNAPVVRPVVLVGHSAGGLYATLYADQHLGEVAGMVLIDPTFTGQFRAFRAAYTSEEIAADIALQEKNSAQLRSCGDALRAGIVEKAEGCQLPLSQLPPPLRPVLLKRIEGTLAELKALTAGGSENLSEDDRQELAAARSFGALPLVVLTAGNIVAPPFLRPEAAAARAAAWRAGHLRLAARSTLGKSAAVPEAGHIIQLDRPDAVVDAVREVVSAVRSPHSK